MRPRTLVLTTLVYGVAAMSVVTDEGVTFTDLKQGKGEATA